jgi:hypothetical protein
MATFGDEIPLGELHENIRRFFNWIVAGSQLDVTTSPLANLSPSSVRLFMGGNRDNWSDMSRLAFELLQDLLRPSSTARSFASRDLNEVLIHHDRLFLCPQVGNSHSGFGPVREVRLDQSSRRLAAKYFTYSEGSEVKLGEYHSLMLYLSRLTHPCLAPIVQFCDPEPGHGPVLVTPFSSKGSLSSFMNTRELTWTEKAQLVGEIVCGLGFLHSEQIVHKSLRPSKLLIDEECHLHLNGFGTSQLVRLGLLILRRLGIRHTMLPNVSHRNGAIRISIIDRNAIFLRLV